MRRRLLCVSACLLLALTVSLQAQNVFVLPGPSGSSAAVTVVTADPFSQTATVTAGLGASWALAGPNGKFYLVSNTSTNTVVSTDSTFANVHPVANFAGALAALISPDGKRLLVLSAGGLLNLIDTSTDKVIAPGLYYGGGIVTGGYAPSDITGIAISQDSTRAYAIISLVQGYSIISIDLKGGAQISNTGAMSSLTALTVGPDGSLYASTQGGLLIVDPVALTTKVTIAVTGRPGKLYITADGHFGVALNQTPGNGPALYIFDLQKRQLLAGVASSAFAGAALDACPGTGLPGCGSIIPVGNDRVLVYSPSAQSIYDVTLDTQTVVPFALGTPGAITAITASNDVAASAHTSTQYLFFTSGSTLYRADLAAGQITGQVAISTTPGLLAFAAPPLTNGTPATVVTFGDNQTVAANVASAPLVVRVLDAQGHPLTGVQVTFTAVSSTVSVATPTVVTSNEGYASTTVKGTAIGQYPITVNAGPLTAAFTLNIGGGSTGPTASGCLSILAGQGEVLSPQTSTAITGSPLVVQCLDANGKPVPNAQVAFTVVSGTGQVTSSAANGAGLNGGTFTVPVDATTGQAFVNFLDTTAPPNTTPGYNQTVVNAIASDGSSVSFVVTTAGTSQVGLPFELEPAWLPLGSGEPNSFTLSAGSTIPGALRLAVSSQTGDAIPNVSLVLLAPLDPNKPAPAIASNLPGVDITKAPVAICAGTFAMSDAKGIINCDLTAVGPPGIYQVVPVFGFTRVYGPLTIVIQPGSVSKVSILAGDQQSGAPGQNLSQVLTVQVTDPSNALLVGTPVTWAVVSGSATLSNTSSKTDSQGRANATVTLGNTPGPVKITVTAGGVTQTFNLNVTTPATAVQVLSGGGQTAQVGSAFTAPLVVRVVDANAKGVAGVAVTFTVTSGSASLGTRQVVTDSTGTASTTVTAGATAGPIVVTAAAGSFSTTASLTAVAIGPSSIVFLNGASFLSAISPGAIVAIQGTNLVNGVQGVSVAQGIVGPLPTTWQGVTVTFNGIPAPIYSVSNVNGLQQVVVQAPYELVGSTSATVVISTQGGGTSGLLTVAIQPYAPGIFETTVYGSRQAVAVHADGTYVSPSNPAKRGENVTMYVNGLGQTTPNASTNAAGIAGQTVAAKLVVGVNGGGVPLVSASLAQGLIGVYTVTFTVPSDATPGAADPVQIIAYDASNNPYFAQGSFLPIQ